MNLSEMTDFVRLQADADIEDAPDATLRVYARAAYNDIKRRVWPWPQKFDNGTLTTVAGQFAYDMPTSTQGTIEYVKSIVGPDDKTVYVDFQTFLALKEGESVSHSTREADHFSTDGSRIYLWPTPSTSGVQYTAYGSRAFRDWPSGSDEPDLPREFDEPICWYMLSRYYMAQEDLELAQLYAAEFERSVNQHIAGAMRTSSVTAGPRVFGGDQIGRHMSYSEWVKRNTEGI